MLMSNSYMCQMLSKAWMAHQKHIPTIFAQETEPGNLLVQECLVEGESLCGEGKDDTSCLVLLKQPQRQQLQQHLHQVADTLCLTELVPPVHKV